MATSWKERVVITQHGGPVRVRGMQEISEAALMTSAQPLPCSRPENAIECEMGLAKKPPETQYGKNVEGRKNLNMVSD